MIKPPPWFVLTRDWLGPVGVALVTTAVISRMFVDPLRIGGQGSIVLRRHDSCKETLEFRGQACYRLNPEFAWYSNSAYSGRQSADSREARHKLLKEVSTPLPSPGAI